MLYELGGDKREGSRILLVGAVTKGLMRRSVDERHALDNRGLKACPLG